VRSPICLQILGKTTRVGVFDKKFEPIFIKAYFSYQISHAAN
jgi:hypothetical protein